MMRLAFCLVLLAFFPSCRFAKKAREYSSFGVGVGSGAGLAAQQAVVSSVTSRAAGGCFADCQFGTTCNRESGYCERVTDAGTALHVLFDGGS